MVKFSLKPEKRQIPTVNDVKEGYVFTVEEQGEIFLYLRCRNSVLELSSFINFHKNNYEDWFKNEVKILGKLEITK